MWHDQILAVPHLVKKSAMCAIKTEKIFALTNVRRDEQLPSKADAHSHDPHKILNRSSAKKSRARRDLLRQGKGDGDWRAL